MTRSEKIEAAAQDLCDNRLGWSDGRNPYAHPEFWEALGDALALPPDAPQVEPDRWATLVTEGEANGCYPCDTCHGFRAHGQPCTFCTSDCDKPDAVSEARCQCADMQGGKLCRACLEDEEATDV